MNTLTYELTGRVARITLDRPERGNGSTFEIPRELAECVERGARRAVWTLGVEPAGEQPQDRALRVPRDQDLPARYRHLRHQHRAAQS
jgi:hypothetical protein